MDRAPVNDNEKSDASSKSGHAIAKVTTSGQTEKKEPKETAEDIQSHGIPNCPLAGCLTIHVKHCWDFKNAIVIQKGTHGFIRLSIGSRMKCTMLRLYKDPKAGNLTLPLIFNEWKYFSIRIPSSIENSIEASNVQQLALELIFFEKNTRVPKVIGKNYIKLPEILNKTAVAHQVELRLKRQVICKLKMDLVITYGSLGYGYSHQMHHQKKTLEAVVERSTFLRCPPPENRQNSHFNVITPKPVPYTDFIGALLQRDAGLGKTWGVPPLVLDMMKRRGRLLEMHKTMEDYRSEEAVHFLERLVMRKGPQYETPWRKNKKVGKKNMLALMPTQMNLTDASKPHVSADQSPTTVTTSAPLTLTPTSQDTSISYEDERQDCPPKAKMEDTTEKPPSAPEKNPPKTTPEQSSATTKPEAVHSDPPPTPPPPIEVQQTIGFKSITAPKPALESASSSQSPDPPQAESTSLPRHLPSVLPENPILVPAPTNVTPKPTMETSLPVHPTSPYRITVVGKKEEEEEKREKQREVVAPVSSLIHAPTQKHVQEECEFRPCQPRVQSDPAESRPESPAEFRQKSPAEFRQKTPAEFRQKTPAESRQESPAEFWQETPAESRQKSPAEFRQKSPAEFRQETPAEFRQETPAEFRQKSPAEFRQKSPAEFRQKSPAEFRQETPAEFRQKSPAEFRQETPAEFRQKSPAEFRQKSPAEFRQKSPAEFRQETPAEFRQKSPAEFRQETPAESRQKSPAEFRQETPAESRQKSPAEHRKETPAESRQESPAEFRQKSPAEFRQETPAESRQKSPAEHRKETPAESRQKIPAEPRKETLAESRQNTPAESRQNTPAESRQNTPAESRQKSPAESRQKSPAESRQEKPAESRQETPAERPSDGELGWNQTDAVRMSSTRKASGEVEQLALGKSGTKKDPPCSTNVRESTVTWTEYRSPEPSSMGGLDRGLPGALWPSSTIHQLLLTPIPTIPTLPTIPPSNFWSSNLRTSSQLPPLGASATFPDIKTLTVVPSHWTAGTNHPSLQRQGLGSSRTGRLGPRLGTLSTINESASLSSWLSPDNLTGSASSGPWSLCPKADIPSLRSGLVYSPLAPISILSASPSSQVNTSPGRTKANKLGKERPKVVDTPHGSIPYQKPNRDKDNYGKM